MEAYAGCVIYMCMREEQVGMGTTSYAMFVSLWALNNGRLWGRSQHCHELTKANQTLPGIILYRAIRDAP